MKIILKCPEGVVPGGADTAVCTEVIPESMDACRLAEQFCRLGRQREGCFLIRLGRGRHCFAAFKGGDADTDGACHGAFSLSGCLQFTERGNEGTQKRGYIRNA